MDRFCSTARASSSAARAFALARTASSGALFSARAFSAPALAALAWACSFLTVAKAGAQVLKSSLGVGERLFSGGFFLRGAVDEVAGR